MSRSKGEGPRDGDVADAPTSAGSGRAAIVIPVLKRQSYRDDDAERPRLMRSPEARREEAIGLALAIDLDPVHAEIMNVADPRPATLIGSGKIEDLAKVIADENIELVVVDHPLTPVQQRNLEKELKAKVLDRTGIILEIFGRRARTKEGVLQVELAHLNYQRGRLVRSWTHLERQRGGAGFMGGPGETQIEADRRMLQEKIIRLKRELETVKRTRALQRVRRKKVPYPIVAIVGYTNAGKSTLFNRLTGAGVVAEDMLFATLDPTLRRLRLPNGTVAIMSDTVGFISALPTHLVAAFRATLEEVVEADLILHLRDISDPDTAAQASDVEHILADLGVKIGDSRHVIEVWNKIDRLDDEAREHLLAEPATGDEAPVAISAVTGEGIDRLLAAIENRIAGVIEDRPVLLRPEQMGLSNWIYENATVTGRDDHDDGSTTLTVRASAAVHDDIVKRLGT